MEKIQLKMGRIEAIGEDRITILNLDGLCWDTLPVTPGEAIYIRDKFGFGGVVLYSVRDGRLIQVGIERSVPELRKLYEILPKETDCSIS